jgi:hypothetical protein
MKTLIADTNSARFSIFDKGWILAICVLGLYLRVPDRFINPQFWAEDGPILFIQAVTGGIQSLIEPYQGALYSFQRIAALISVQFPWQYVPTVFMAFAWLAFVVTVLWCLSDRLQIEWPIKIAMALCLAYAPVKNETYLNLINAHWGLCGFGLLLLLMSSAPKNIWQTTFDVGICALLGLTGPFCLIYSPLFVFRAYLQRDRHSYVLLSIIVICTVVQILQLPTRDYQVMGGVLNTSVEQFLSVLDFRFVWMFVGYEFLPFRTLKLPFGILLFLAILALFMIAIRENYRVGGYLRTVPLFAAALVVGATVVSYREMPEALINATRYFFIPIIAFLWGLTLAASSKPRVFVPFLIVSGVAFLSHPSWDEYDMPDLNWNASVECLQKNPNCVVPIHPLYFDFSVFSPQGNRLISAKEIFAQMNVNASSIRSLKKTEHAK